MKIGQPKLSERVNPGVISEDEDSSSKVSVKGAVHVGLSAVHSGDSLRPLPGLTNCL